MTISYSRRSQLFGFLLLSPAALIVGVVILLPLVEGIRLSLFQVKLGAATERFVGLDNYFSLLFGAADPGPFLKSIITTGAFSAASAACTTGIGLSLALLLNRRQRLRRALRSAFLLPWAIPWVSTSLIFLLLLDPNWGVVNYILARLGLIHDYVAWFGDSGTALAAIVVINVWKLLPFTTLAVLGALQSLSSEIVDAAAADGAGTVTMLRYVTLPHIRPVLAVVILSQIVWSFQAFAPMFILTNGGPGGVTTTLSVYLYKKAFYEFNFGEAAAVGALWLVALLIFGALWLRFLRRSD